MNRTSKVKKLRRLEDLITLHASLARTKLLAVRNEETLRRNDLNALENQKKQEETRHLKEQGVIQVHPDLLWRRWVEQERTRLSLILRQSSVISAEAQLKAKSWVGREVAVKALRRRASNR